MRELVDQNFIVRSAWIFGLGGKNSIRTMLHLGQINSNLRVVSDQVGIPTHTLNLARLLVDIIETDKYGTYHATNKGGFISWYDFACKIFRQAKMPVTTAGYGLSKAARPFNSRSDTVRLVENDFAPLPHWHDVLKGCLKEMQKNPGNLLSGALQLFLKFSNAVQVTVPHWKLILLYNRIVCRKQTLAPK